MDKLSAWLGKQLGRPITLAIVIFAIALVNLVAYLTPTLRDSINIQAGAWTGYLSVFVVVLTANATNRSNAAMHGKQDHVISVLDKADNAFMRVEDQSEQRIEELRIAHETANAASDVLNEGREKGVSTGEG